MDWDLGAFKNLKVSDERKQIGRNDCIVPDLWCSTVGGKTSGLSRGVSEEVRMSSKIDVGTRFKPEVQGGEVRGVAIEVPAKKSWPRG